MTKCNELVMQILSEIKINLLSIAITKIGKNSSIVWNQKVSGVKPNFKNKGVSSNPLLILHKSTWCIIEN